MGWLEKFFGTGLGEDSDPEHSASLAKIENLLAGLPENDARYLACVALLTARVANIDSEVTEGEKKRITDVLRNQMSLPQDQANAVLAIALTSEEQLSVEFHIVTRRLNEFASREQKLELLHLLFHVAAEDDVTEQESDNIGAISTALLLPRSDFLSVRAAYREHRKIFKDLPKR